MIPRITISKDVRIALREDLARASLPILDLGGELRDMMRARIHDAGLAGDGAPWSPYKTRQPKRGDKFYWSGVGQPQPELHRLVIAGPGTRHAGRAAYPSFGHYCEAIGFARTGGKRFRMTNELAESLAVIQPRPTMISILYPPTKRSSPYFRAKSGQPYTNQKVASFAFRLERMSPLQPTAGEVSWLMRELAARIPTTLLSTLKLAEDTERGVKKANRLIGQANKLLQGGV